MKRDLHMKRDLTLLGFTLPNEQIGPIFRSDPAMPIQTHSFAWAIVRSLQQAGLGITLLSSAPVSNFPRAHFIAFRGKPFTVGNLEGRTLTFINILLLKHITRFSACLVEGTRALRRWRPQTLLIHGVHSPYLWYGVLVRATRLVRTVVILSDPPGVVLPADGRCVRTLKALDVRLVRLALRWTDGVIALTRSLASDYAPGRPCLVIEGIVDSQPRDPIPSAVHSREFRGEDNQGMRIAYAGGLKSEYGVGRLVTAVEGLRYPPVTLFIFGRGPLLSWIESRAEVSGRVRPPQLVEQSLVRAIYSDMDLLVQPRPVNQSFVRYSFPSKLLEYMASGTPVLTTRLHGIPPEYDPYVYWIDDDSEHGIRLALERILQLKPDDRRAKGLAAAEFVQSTRGSVSQGKKIADFLAAISSRRALATLP